MTGKAQPIARKMRVDEIRRMVEDLDPEKRRRAHVETAEVDLSDLRKQLQESVKELMPKCHLCGGGNIKVRTEAQHHQRPGPLIIGPGGRGQSWTTISFKHLYCDDCGQTYYTDKMAAKIGNLLTSIHQAENKLNELRHPFRC